MKIDFRSSTPRDREKIRELLIETKLPVESVESGVTRFYVAESGGGIVGIAGFEFYGGDALLRSVAIEPGLQRHGLGSEIVDHMLEEARLKKARRVILLTETAEDFFLKKGFDVVDRSKLGNEEIKKSSEFEYACPKSAVCMSLELS